MSGLRIKGLGEEIATLANLPWDKPLEGWPEDEVLTGMRGIYTNYYLYLPSSWFKSSSNVFSKSWAKPWGISGRRHGISFTLCRSLYRNRSATAN